MNDGLGTGLHLIIPPDLFANTDRGVQSLNVWQASERVFIARKPAKNGTDKNAPIFVATSVLCKPREHGLIYKTPRNLEELHEIATAGGTDLLRILRDELRSWNTHQLKEDGTLDLPMILIVAFPTKRTIERDPETIDTWAFATNTSIRDLGVRLGCWRLEAGSIGHLLEIDEAKRGADVACDVLNPHLDLMREAAARSNARRSADTRRIVAVGVGALGSHAIMNLGRAGFGQWTLIDKDLLFPHNLARHQLDGFWTGRSKAAAMEAELNSLFQEEIASAIHADVLAAGEARTQIDNAFSEAALILDCSASIPVARHLAQDVDLPTRRISAFLNPGGTDLIILAEDAQRSITLDSAEMQYYRALVTSEQFREHLRQPEGRLRYARSCRDLTSSIPQSAVACHAAILAKSLQQLVQEEDAFIAIWQLDVETSEVRRHQIPIFPPERFSVGNWTIQTDAFFFERTFGLRRSKLPNETGGILDHRSENNRSIKRQG